MSRLIDDEQFITEMEINIGNIYNPDVIKGMRFGIDLINSRPTAYDVEAVVKQIEDASVELYGFAKVVGLDKVIEIVRNGGVK